MATKRGRFSASTHPFDFNTKPLNTAQHSHKRRAEAVEKLASPTGRKQLMRFLVELDRIDDLPAGQLKAKAVAALKAIVELLQASGEDRDQYFSRPFGMLLDNLERGASVRRVLHSDDRVHQVKAATAFVIDYFGEHCGKSRKLRNYFYSAALILTERNFPFEGKNSKQLRGAWTAESLKPRADMIEKSWRREYNRAGFGGPAGEIYRRYKKQLPFEVGSDDKARFNLAASWWYGVLAHYGY